MLQHSIWAINAFQNLDNCFFMNACFLSVMQEALSQALNQWKEAFLFGSVLLS